MKLISFSSTVLLYPRLVGSLYFCICTCFTIQDSKYILIPIPDLNSVTPTMSAGMNAKAISKCPKNNTETDVGSNYSSSGGMRPSPGVDPKQQYGELSNPTLQYQHTTKSRASYSASLGPAEVLCGTALKNHLLQQKTGLYYQRRTDGTRSAYSSPQTQRRKVPRSKDTLDLRTSTVTHKALIDLQVRRNTKQNWTFGKYRLMNVGNATEDKAQCRLAANIQSRQRRGQLFTKGANGNEMAGMSYSIQKAFRNISNQGQQTSGGEVSCFTTKAAHPTFNMPRRWSEPGKVNMAAVAPFRFR